MDDDKHRMYELEEDEEYSSEMDLADSLALIILSLLVFFVIAG